ncbi:MAG: HlyD family efflux transporter periplasmic adaptor subunit [Rikenellaceae bacterium]|nr:HlyD family efflux transporter periplasmic adaptor subunit [Rikenellaceae bacterium]
MDIKIEHKNKIRKKHIPYILGGVFVLLVIAWAAFGNNVPTLKVDPRMFTISTVETNTFNDYVRITGQVRPVTTIQLSPLERGRVEEIIAEEGSTVATGDVVVRLSNSNLTMQILDSEASLAEKENLLRNTMVSMEQQKLDLQQTRLQLDLDLERKERTYLQNKRLYDEKLISNETYLQSKEDYEYTIKRYDLVRERQTQDSIYRSIQILNMEESLESMRRNMKMIRERVANLDVKAPVSGQLGSLDVVLGQTISEGSRMGEINDLSDFKIESSLDEHYIDRVIAGLEGTFERQNQEYGVLLSKVYPDVKGGQFKVDFRFTGERPENIRTGQSYYINLQLGQSSEGILIPRGSFYQKTGGSWIFVVTPDGSRAYKRKINISRQNPQYYEVTEGLEPGERVITSSYDNFGDNELLIFTRNINYE